MFDAVDFYHLAAKLHREGTPAAIRTSIGRAYYAVFLVARDKAKITDTGKGVHNNVAEYYTQRNSKVSNQLKSCKMLRHIADYKLDKPLTNRDSGNVLREAREILVYFGITGLPTK